MLLTYKENVHSTQMYIPLNPLFSRHKGIGVQFTDEPTGALDYNTGKAILKLLQDTCREKGMTVIVITHNSAIAPMADRVIHIKNGKVSGMEMNEHPVPVETIEW